MDEVDETYGIDHVDDAEAEASVEPVPESILTVSDAVLQELAQRVNPLAESDNYELWN